MQFVAEPAPLSACLLADHLDAVLAVGEDLLKVRGKLPPPLDDPVEQILAARAAQRRTVERVRTLEVALLARVLTARERAAELARTDARFKVMARLFASGTTVLADAAAECSDSTDSDFETGDGLTAYLRPRGMLPDGALALAESVEIAVEENFLLCKAVPLGSLMDLAARFLDALEQHFDLYGIDADEIETSLDAHLPRLPAPASDKSAPKIETLIETTLQAMFEPADDKEARRAGWAPGSLLAALAQIDAENEIAKSKKSAKI